MKGTFFNQRKYPRVSLLHFTIYTENQVIKHTRINMTGNRSVYHGDSISLIETLENESVDVVITSPPYWGQRASMGIGIEEDPRDYINHLVDIFTKILPKLSQQGVVWLNICDSFNTPINWKETDYKYSTLGPDKNGLSPENSAYKKNRIKRKAFLNKEEKWLKYGNLLALPYRIVLELVNKDYYFRGEVIWKKNNPMPEGLCRRPHRVHESIYLLSKNEDHNFCKKPPVKSIWEFPNEPRKEEYAHFSRFPEELPKRCILASGFPFCEETIIFDPFAGSGTTGVVAKQLGCSFIGFEIDNMHTNSANKRIKNTMTENVIRFENVQQLV
jgi:DNA modification methylase